MRLTLESLDVSTAACPSNSPRMTSLSLFGVLVASPFGILGAAPFGILVASPFGVLVALRFGLLVATS